MNFDIVNKCLSLLSAYINPNHILTNEKYLIVHFRYRLNGKRKKFKISKKILINGKNIIDNVRNFGYNT